MKYIKRKFFKLLYFLIKAEKEFLSYIKTYTHKKKKKKNSAKKKIVMCSFINY